MAERPKSDDLQPAVQVVRKAKLKTTGGRATDHNSRTLCTCDTNIGIIQPVFVAVAILLILGGIAIAVFLVSDGSYSSPRYFGKLSCDEDTPTPFHINSCQTSKCTFDLSVCEEECPFGFMADESGCEQSCECALEGIFEGDIYFTEYDLPFLTKVYGYSVESDFAVFSGSATTRPLWNDSPRNGRHKIAFELSSVPFKAKQAITEAIKRFREQTCIDFVERTTEERYFRFMSGRGCMSIVGRHRKNGQQISIGRGCEIPGTVQHELLHLLGFYHEHSRPDRDSYLIVVKDNIAKERFANFKKRLKSQVRSLDSEYDLTSILHYPSNAFSKNGEATLRRRKDDQLIFAQREAFTKDDLYEVNVLYDCYKKEGSAAQWISWTPWSTCDETCGLGERLRFRKCMKGPELVSGCKGSRFQKLVCHAPPCPAPKGRWSSWGEFTECPRGCGGGFQWRKRKCTPHGECNGVSYQGRSCKNQDGCSEPEWGLWSSWGTCSANCGGGLMDRRRQCIGNQGMIAQTCEHGDGTGSDAEKKNCNTSPCGSLHIVEDGETWSSCSATCDGVRTRMISGREESEKCNVGECGKFGPAVFQAEVARIISMATLCDPMMMNIWLFGDFNGDGLSDVLCSSGNGEYKLAHADSSGPSLNLAWSGSLQGCGSGQKVVGDFDGDGKDDILCKNVQRRRLAIKFSTKDGKFTDQMVDAGDFCTEPTSHLVVIYASGDGKADIACHTSTKAVEIRLNE